MEETVHEETETVVEEKVEEPLEKAVRKVQERVLSRAALSKVEKLEPADEAEVRKVLATLDEVVAETGADYRYNKAGGSCLYVREAKPDCLAARVLAKLGMATEDLASYEGNTCDQMVNSHLGGKPKPPVGAYALYTLRAAQYLQDAGLTWGEARAGCRGGRGRTTR